MNIRSFKSCIPKFPRSKMCYSSNKKFYKTCIPKRCCIIDKWYEKIYKSPSYDASLKAHDSFEKSWGEKYSYTIKSWKNNFDELITFFDYQTEIRKMIYTTNTIENINRNIRKITKTKDVFTNTNRYQK